MEEKKEKTKKPEYVNAQVPRIEHSVIRKLAFDANKDARDLYAEIVPLGLAEWRKNNSLIVQSSN